MYFTDFVSRLQEKYGFDQVSVTQPITVTDLALIDPAEPFFDQTIYFGYASQLQGLPFLPKQCILEVEDSAASFSASSFSTSSFSGSLDGNIAFVPARTLFSVFNACKALLQQVGRISIYEELTALADRTQNMDAIIDAASIKLGQPLLFCDQSFQIISVSSSLPVTDPLWVENIRQGYCNYDFIREVKSLSTVADVHPTSKNSLEVTCIKSPFRKLSCKVFDGNHQIGFLLLIGERPIESKEFLSDTLPLVSRAVSYTVSHYVTDLAGIHSVHQQILYDLLIGANPSDLSSQLSSVSFGSHLIVLFLGSRQYPVKWFKKKDVANHLKLILPGTHVTYHKHGIVALVPLKDQNAFSITEDFLSIIRKFAKKEKVIVGISNDFSSVENFRTYYEQAHQSFLLGQRFQPEASVYQYMDHYFFDLLSQIPDAAVLSRFIHPAITILEQYDAAQNTQLLPTLQAYLSCDCISKDTAAALYIHRNSLAYRMERIQDLTNLDLENAHTKFLLQLSFYILAYGKMGK